MPEKANSDRIKCFRDLNVYQAAMDATMRIYQMSKTFPDEEKYSLTDQMRRSSRSVCANIAEAWRKRRYRAHFQSKLSDAEAEAEETRVWLEIACKCRCITHKTFLEMDDMYDKILGQLVRMISKPEDWVIR